MAEPTTPIFFHRCAFQADPARIFEALRDDASWMRTLGGTPLDSESGTKIRLNHPASGGVLQAAIAPRGDGSRVTLTLFADSLSREGLESLARAADQVFDLLSERLDRASDALLPRAWPAVFESPRHPARILRRSDYRWSTARYPDAPEDTMGESAELTSRLGVTQFGADVHRLDPGQRSCRNHSEFHEQEGFLVLSGRCQIEIEERVYDLEVGDFCVTFPGEEHHLFNLGTEPCEILMFGGPDVFGSGAIYPHGRDDAWRERVSLQGARAGEGSGR